MPTTSREELIAQGYAQGFPRGYALAKLMGKADVFAELLIGWLDHRGFALANELRERITICTDEDLLLGWFERALTATTLAEVFDDSQTRHSNPTIREELIAQGFAKGKAEGLAKGKVEGTAEMLIRLLDARKIPLTDELLERITSCTDEDLLQHWLDHVLMARILPDVVDG